jgi:hypothetical protein
MQSKASTVKEYLASLPEDRRAAIQAVREVILKNLDRGPDGKSGFEEGMQYGMIGFFVPHSIYPAGYHCDPKQPLPFAALASQKQYMSMYVMCLYIGPASAGLLSWFEGAFKAAGKKLDMGKACIRFKKIEDLPLEVIGELFRRTTMAKYIAAYEANLLAGRGGSGESKKVAKKAATKPAKTPAKSPAKKLAKKPVDKSAKKTAKKATSRRTT